MWSLLNRLGGCYIKGKTSGGRLAARSAARRLSSAKQSDNRHRCSLDDRLGQLKDPTAIQIHRNLTQKNPYLRTSKPLPLRDALENARQKHPNHVLLTWNGSMYEAHGIDAVLCVEHCNIQPTGLTPHAEIPPEQLQTVVEALRRAGLSVAVYNFIATMEHNNDHNSEMVQGRTLVFSHDATERPDHSDAEQQPAVERDHRKALAIMHNRAGFSVSVIDPAKRSVEIHERLTMSAAAALVQRVDSRVVIFQNGNPQVKKLLAGLPTLLHYEPIQGAHHNTDAFHSAACLNIKRRLAIAQRFKVKRHINWPVGANALDDETAMALGLCGAPSGQPSTKIMAIHLQMLPEDAQQYKKSYMQFRLMHPLTEDMAEKVRYLNTKLAHLSTALLDVKPVAAAKLRALLSQRKVDPSHLQELLETLKAFTYYTDTLQQPINKRLYALAIADLNVDLKPELSKKRANECTRIIEAAVAGDADSTQHSETAIPCIDEYFKRSEAYIACVKRNLIFREREQVDEAACDLLRAVSKYYLGINDSVNSTADTHAELRNVLAVEISSHVRAKGMDDDEGSDAAAGQVLMNEHYIMLKKIHSAVDHTALKTTETLVGAQRVRYYTNKKVTEALTNYRNQLTLAEEGANRVLLRVAKTLAPYAQTIIVISHFLVVLQTLAAHVTMAVAKGWTMPALSKSSDINILALTTKFVDASEPVPIQAKLKGGTHVLQGPNNSGRSTSIIAIMGACLAANTGLYVPCATGSKVPVFTRYLYHAGATGGPEAQNAPFEHTINALEHVLALAQQGTLVTLDNLCANVEAAQAGGLGATVIKRLCKSTATAIVATNVRVVRGQEHEDAHVNRLVKRRGTVEFVEIADEPHAALRDTLPHNRFLAELQVDIDAWMAERENSPAMKGIRGNVNEYAGTEAPIAQMGGDSTNDGWSQLADIVPQKLREAAAAVVAAIRETALCDASKDVVHIMEGGVPPPMLNNAPVLYVLLIPTQRELQNGADRAKATVNEGDVHEVTPTAVYVGETGNIVGRLRAHRAKPQSTIDEYMGKTFMDHETELTQFLRVKNKLHKHNRNQASTINWQELHALAIKAPSRMDSRIRERKLIRELYKKQAELTLLSHRDGVYRDVPAID